jgi:hypothetical protein
MCRLETIARCSAIGRARSVRHDRTGRNAISMEFSNTHRALPAGLVAAPLIVGRAAAQNSHFIQPARAEASGFMAVADDMLRLAVEAGDQPFGAVVVKARRIVGWGPSRVVSDTDPTAHAEMIAFRDAAKRLGTGDLSGCTMYGTSHPCPNVRSRCLLGECRQIRLRGRSHRWRCAAAAPLLITCRGWRSRLAG